MTINGKINRKALPEPNIHQKTGKIIAPRDEIEQKLTEIWANILGIKKNLISIEANFFQLGGHSLKANILALEISKTFKIKTPLKEILKSPTIKDISVHLRKVHSELKKAKWKNIVNHWHHLLPHETIMIKYKTEFKPYTILYSNRKIRDLDEIIKKNNTTDLIPHYILPQKNIPFKSGEIKEISINRFEKILGLKSKKDFQKSNKHNPIQHFSNKIEKNQREFHVYLQSLNSINKYYCGEIVNWYLDEKMESVLCFEIPVENVPNSKTLKESLIQLINHQSLLRSEIINENGQYQFNEYDYIKHINLPILDLSEYNSETQKYVKEQLFSQLRKSLQEQSPLKNTLFKIAAIKINVKDYIFLFVLDHKITDVESDRILKNYFENYFSEKSNDQTQENKILHFKNFVNHIALPSSTPQFINKFCGRSDYKQYELAVLHLPQKNPKGKQLLFSSPYVLEFYLHPHEGQPTNLFGNILFLASNICGIQWDTKNVPMRILSNIRVFDELNFYNTIADMHNEIQIVFDLHKISPEICYGQWQKWIKIYSTEKIYFYSMAYRERKKIIRSPININYIGSITTQMEKSILKSIKTIPFIPYPISAYSIGENKIGILFFNGITPSKKRAVLNFLNVQDGKFHLSHHQTRSKYKKD